MVLHNFSIAAYLTYNMAHGLTSSRCDWLLCSFLRSVRRAIFTAITARAPRARARSGFVSSARNFL